MAAVSNEVLGGVGSSVDGGLSDQQPQCLSGEALAEWRSSEQLENGIPSTSPPYWDSDDEEDAGPKPLELYGKYTWKIDKFSQINKRELRSNPFEVGGYKWYILIYPQGCDVCNHLSLFLCVANHDKLLPGWSHFAQFTIAVVNKDPKKSKYSDTLHRFWKKEHDWGWKKFMELSKVFDGFIDSDTLIIKAQVQVIRERSDRPFRCLDCQYRRELIRVYLTNVEQSCRRFVEERRNKLVKLIEDKARWSSFSAFWLSLDYRSRHHMSQEKTDSILKLVVKHFFIEKEVTSTLVMDSLYSGLKALEYPYKEKKNKSRYLDSEGSSVPIIRVEKDMFVLVDDVLPLLERATIEPLPPRDEKGPQNRTKDGAAGEELNKDYIQRDERRLTELGRHTIEIFILAHIFSKIEVAYQEAVALKKQEELIREEEAAWLAETEQKSRRRSLDKDKKSKKKQGKQKRNNRKGKDSVRDDNSSCVVQEEVEKNGSITENKDPRVSSEEMALANSVVAEDISDVSDSVDFSRRRLPPDHEESIEKSVGTGDVSDVCDSVDFAPEGLLPDSEKHVVISVSWNVDTAGALPTAEPSSSGDSGLSSMQSTPEINSSSIVDDSLSTSSSDSIPSMPRESILPHYKSMYSSSRRGRSYQLKQRLDSGQINEENTHKSEAVQGAAVSTKDVVRALKGVDIVPPAAAHPSNNVAADGRGHPVVKDKEAICLQSNFSGKYAAADAPEGTTSGLKHSFLGPSRETASVSNKKLGFKIISNPLVSKKLSPDRPDRPQTSVSSVNSVENVDSKANTQRSGAPENVNTLKINHQKSAATENLNAFKANVQNPATPKPVEMVDRDGVHLRPEKLVMYPLAATTDTLAVSPQAVVSRPYSAPLVPSSRVSMSSPRVVPTSPVLARSASVAGRLGPESSMSATQSYAPVSYRNAITGNPATGSSSAYPLNHHPTSSMASCSVAPLVSAPLFSQFGSDRMDANPMKPSLSFGMVNHNPPQRGQPVRLDSVHMDGNRILLGDDFDPSGTQYSSSSSFPVRMLGRQSQSSSPDEFPHLDIINDLLEDENRATTTSISDSSYRSFQNEQSRPTLMNHLFGFPDDTALTTTTTSGFGRTRSFSNDRFLYNYSTGSSMEARRDMNPHGSGQLAGLIPSQWPAIGPEAPFLNARSSNNPSYLYNSSEHQNVSLGSSRFPVYRPANRM